MHARVVALVCAAAAGLVVTAASAGSSRHVEQRTARRTGTIAFLRFPSDAWSPGAAVQWPSLFTVRADGSRLRRLTPPDTGVYAYASSPDSGRIAYTDTQGSVWLVDRDGSGRRLLVERLGGSSLAWSPDGSALAVTAAFPTGSNWQHAHHSRIVVVPSDGARPRRLRSGDAEGPAWSPRGDDIAYRSGNGRVWLISRRGGQARRVVDGGGEPRWSADGSLLGLVTAVRLRQGCLACVKRYGGIAVVQANGTGFHLVTVHAYNEHGFAWSPIGHRILYGRENRQGIYVVDADGRHDLRVTRDSPIPVGWGALAWSPDGRSIAYDTDRTGGGDIYVVGVDGRGRARLTDSPDIDVAPSWAPR
jgi:Tol biopolymer transport system component